MMNQIDLATIAKRLRAMYENSRLTPFPYQGTRELLLDADDEYQGFIPDLDMHSSTIAGYCSWGEGLLRWDKEKINQAQIRLDKGFFEKYDEYKPLESMITQPDLRNYIQLFEKMRTELTRFFEQLQAAGEQKR